MNIKRIHNEYMFIDYRISLPPLRPIHQKISQIPLGDIKMLIMTAVV